jgi:hypothetical protein
LFEGGFEVVDDFPGENVGGEKIVGAFDAVVCEPENIEGRKSSLSPFPDPLSSRNK